MLLLFFLFFPYSSKHVFSPQHPDLLFIFSHANETHLLRNVLALFIAWIAANKARVNDKKVFAIFFLSFIPAILLSLLFDIPILGASVGIYTLFGYLLPYLEPTVPMPVSFSIILLSVLFEGPISASPWEKLFHIFGLFFGALLHYFEDLRRWQVISLIRQLGLPEDEYAKRVLEFITRYELKKHKALRKG